MRRKAALAVLTLIAALLLVPVYAHEEGAASPASDNLEHQLWASSLKVLLAVSIISGLFLLAALSMPTAPDMHKTIMFFGIAIPLILGTIYLAGTTMYLNAIAETNGPVHWHADFEIWRCGEKLVLAKPSGLSNRIGSESVHEHGDSRMHIEGVVVKKGDVSLHHFFEAVGGSLTDKELAMPTDSGMVSAHNGDTCSDGTPGILQGFVYKTQNSVVKQEKLADPENYVLSPYSQVPPGDCIIIEFGQKKEKTEHVCETYRHKMTGESHGS